MLKKAGKKCKKPAGHLMIGRLLQADVFKVSGCVVFYLFPRQKQK
jgi:hypothetical protein